MAKTTAPTEHPREVELKLEVDPGAAEALATRLTALLGPAGAEALTSTYYDTPNQALRAAGVSLRVRTGGGAPVQTVKQSRTASAGLFDRDEWETALPDATPDFDAFAATPAGAALAIDPARLAPAFETIIERAVWRTAQGSAAIEVALDRGQIAARGRTERFAELECELKQGTPRDLFDLVDRIGLQGQARPGVRTKSERGYALLGGEGERAFKAEPVHLARHMTTAEAFKAVVHACLRHFWLNEPLLVARRTPEALHQTRVALRRLRSALSLFKPVVADDRFDPLRTTLREVSRHLGEARNLDVYLKAGGGPEAEAAGGAAFREAVERRRAAAYDGVVARLRSDAFRNTAVDLLAWTEAGAWLDRDEKGTRHRRDARVRRFAAAVLDKRRRRIKRQGRHLERLDAEARHRVRIEAKKLRYASEFFAGLARSDKAQERRRRFTEALEDLQEQLGALNDIAAGHEIARAFAGRETDAAGGLPAALAVDAAQDERIEPLLAKAADAQARFVETKPFWSSWPR